MRHSEQHPQLAEVTNSQRATTYSNYLRVPELLSLQTPRDSGPEHDEMLFIVIHQTYELWFKTLLHEFARAGERLQAGASHDALATLGRIRTILKTLVSQVDILETMTPLQFGTFRDRLDAASGFQSAQFRELEIVLGRRDPAVLANFAERSPEHTALEAALDSPSIWQHAMKYLATRSHMVPTDVLDADPRRAYQPDVRVQDAVLHAYRTDGEVALVLERLVDIDEGLQEWRYRHVKMVERTIGHKSGTGGSSGAEYLASTLFRPVFPDLWLVRDRF
ncbi:MAG: hypothetical protein RL072_798 [Actinomycetota bacterium]|jgi:tryptophan 2,3-dioxygenase